MKRYGLTLIAIAMSIIVLAQDGIQFSKASWDDALAKAKSENKNIFIDCYTTWCGPCKKLDANTFPLKEVGDYFNANFVSIKRDMEKEGEGVALRKKFDVNVFPTLLICNSKGEEIHRFTGYKTGEQIIEAAKNAKEGNINTAYYQKEYNAGNRQPEFMNGYMEYLNRMYQKGDLSTVAEEYLTYLGEEKWTDEESWKMINSYLKKESGNSPIIKYVYENRDTYKKLYGEQEVDKRLNEVFRLTASSFYTREGGSRDGIAIVDYKAYKQYLSKLKKMKVAGVDGIKLYGDMFYALVSKDWDKYVGFIRERIKDMDDNIQARQLYSYAYQIQNHCDVKHYREEAVKWCELGIKSTDQESIIKALNRTKDLLLKES